MMKKTSENKLVTVKRILFAAVGVLVALVMILSFFSRDEITRSRSTGEYTVVENVSSSQLVSGDSVTDVYRFTLSETEHAETLAFFINHHNTEVYVGDECVYTVKASQSDTFSTTGGTWVMIPLYDDDIGKEIRVLFTPIYKNYREDAPEFLLGSEIAVHNFTLHRALPALVLCLCAVFAGVLLICLAVYHNVKGSFNGRLYALGLLAISAGLWRFSYDRVAYMLFENREVFIYTLSIVSLMTTALSMLNSIKTSEKGKNLIRICSCCYSVIYILQLSLQAFGIADLRQTLKAIHLTIIVSAATFTANSIIVLFKSSKQEKRRLDFSWLFGLGVAIDLLIYYSADASFKMVFTLIAILAYSVYEGVSLLFTYIEQKNAFEEMETQLTLSRTTTMMSQIRSHFVFNILNAISGMCKYDPEMADDTVVRFARYLRNNIDIMEKDGNIPFKTDLRQVEDYVALEQVRFGDKIEFYTDIEADDFSVPPLILQPVVENAIKHGVSKKQGNGTIILRTRDIGKSIVITVEDDGVGFDMAELEKEKSVGIRNIRFRLKHLVNGTLNIASEVGKGTTVTITIPKEEK